MVSVRKSQLPIDLVKFPDADTDEGLGVFQDIGGRSHIDVRGNGIESILLVDIHPLQNKYKMESGFDEDYVIVPTVDTIRSGDVPIPFRIQHSDDPTHEMDWVEDGGGRSYPHSHYVIRPKMYLNANTEITIDYNF